MRKYKPIEFQFDPEIEKTTRRFQKKNRNSKVVVARNNHGEIQLVNGQEGQNRQSIQGQPGNNNIIYMTYNRDRVIRDYAVLTLYNLK